MAILKIRDADGNIQEIIAIRGKDGKDGKDGVDGINGEDGNDYVLTNDDKQEIAELVMQTANIAYVGTGTPASDLGKDGDIYIVTE